MKKLILNKGTMKYTTEIEINKPIDKVIELFYNPENMKHWYPGFVSFEPLTGEIGKEGAKSKIKYKVGKREIEMIQTITKHNFLGEFWGTYKTKGIWYEVKNYFIEIDSNRTKWKSKTELRCSGFMKLISVFMPGMFKKQGYKYLVDFKNFAENQN